MYNHDLEKINKEQFEKGREIAKIYIKQMIDSIEGWHEYNDIGILNSTSKINWYFRKGRTLVIHGENGVSNEFLNKCANGINDYVLKPFNIKMGIELDSDSNGLDLIINSICKGDTIKNTRESKSLLENTEAIKIINSFLSKYKESNPNKGHIIVTTKRLEGAWGITGHNSTIISSCSVPEKIAAHEFMHLLYLDKQKLTKDSGRNCLNNCLMNYSLRIDGLFCEPCEVGAKAYIAGINNILNEYDNGLNK